MICELCSNKGGAYKQTDKGKWIHSICSNWIPEVFLKVTPGGLPMPTLSHLDKKRYRLPCLMCKTKGAAVQCTYGRCIVAFHPWCVLHHGHTKGITKRVVKDQDGEAIWEIYCKSHASCVTEPVKPRPKSKMAPAFAEDDDFQEYARPKATFSRSARHNLPRVMSMAHMNRKHERSGAVEQVGGKGLASKAYLSSSGSSAASSTTFPIRFMSEWPGQAEGEAMDLDHFWKVVCSAYPEDYPTEWTEAMVNPVLKAVTVEKDDDLLCMPCLGTAADMADLMGETEEKYAQLGGGERERFSIFDEEKRSQLLSNVWLRVEQLTGAVSTSTASAAPTSAAAIEQGDDGVPEGDANLAHLMLSRAVAPPLMDYDKFLVQSRAESGSKAKGKQEPASSTMKVLFDGNKRRSAKFRVELTDATSTDKSAIAIDGSEPTSKLLIGETVETPVSADSKQNLSATIVLDSFSLYDDAKAVYLPDKVMVPSNEDDVFARMIRTDQEAYLAITSAMEKKISAIMATPAWRDQQATFLHDKNVWDVDDQKYMYQKSWKRISVCMFRGMRDQQKDFNLQAPEVLPASWTIQVTGRPPAEVAADVDEAEPAEDAVCMCCFDGSSKDGNNIVFCDGCNAALHQACYGVSEVPEGDYFCDRCQEVKELAEDDDFNVHEAKVAIMCCLCPMIHGGLKPTTDGRWVHLCCATWAQDSIIRDLTDMSPVDVSNVVVQQPRETGSTVRGGPKAAQQDDDSGELNPCIFCKVYGGALSHCCAESSIGCNAVFHPLCAWFAGVHVEVKILDPTFMGMERSGLYPSGLEFNFYCNEHCPVGDGAKKRDDSRQEQRDIRLKYAIKDDDLDCIPGSKRRKGKKAKSRPAGEGRSSGGAVVKDLNPDLYDASVCAICMVPIAPLVFMDTIELKKVEAEKNAAAAAIETEGVKQDAVIEVAGATSSSSATNAHKNCLTCSRCQIAVHSKCFTGSGGVLDGVPEQWECDSCSMGLATPVRCMLCPRIGGFLKPTTEGGMCHVFCARNGPGQVKIHDGQIDVRMIPKENKKQKCIICNRKTGACLKCSSLGCTNLFHPLCAERSSKAYFNTRNGVLSAFCADHLPDGVEKDPRGFWVDPFEVSRIRQTLDRARTLVDLCIKREKLKKLHSKAEGDLFAQRIGAMIDRGKGRKHISAIPGANEDEDNLSFLDEYSDSESDDEDGGLGVLGKPEVFPRGEDITVETSDGAESFISGTWTKGKEVNVPKRVVVSYSGLLLGKRDIVADGADPKKVFMSRNKASIQRQVVSTRRSCGIFSSQKECDDFPTKLNRQIKQFTSMADDVFRTEMLKFGFKVVYPAENAAKKATKKKNKVGYAVVDEFDGFGGEYGPAGDSPVSKRRRRETAGAEQEEVLETVEEKAERIAAQKERAAQALIQVKAQAIKSAQEASNASGPYRTQSQLAQILQEEFTTKGVYDTFHANNSGFATILAMSGISSDDCCSQEDWEVFPDDKLYTLERRMMDILHVASEYEMPLSAQDNTKRQPITDWIEIPYDDLPDYDARVRRVITIGDLREKLQNHAYRSLSHLTKDFYAMLNNGRFMSWTGSQTFKDSDALAKVYEEVRKTSKLSDTSSCTATPDANGRMSLCRGKVQVSLSEMEDAIALDCGRCNVKVSGRY